MSLESLGTMGSGPWWEREGVCRMTEASLLWYSCRLEFVWVAGWQQTAGVCLMWHNYRAEIQRANLLCSQCERD